MTDTPDSATYAQMCTTQELIDELCARNSAVVCYGVKDHDVESVFSPEIIWYDENLDDDGGMWEMFDRLVTNVKEFCLDSDWPEPGVGSEF